MVEEYKKVVLVWYDVYSGIEETFLRVIEVWKCDECEQEIKAGMTHSTKIKWNGSVGQTMM